MSDLQTDEVVPTRIPGANFPTTVYSTVNSGEPIRHDDLPYIILSPPNEVAQSVRSSGSSTTHGDFRNTPEQSDVTTYSTGTPYATEVPIAPYFTSTRPTTASTSSSFRVCSATAAGKYSSFELFGGSFNRSPGVAAGDNERIRRQGSRTPARSFGISRAANLYGPHKVTDGRTVSRSASRSPQTTVVI